MKILFAIAFILLIWAASLKPTIEEKVEQQIKESEALCDSASYYLHELQKVNDSLIDINFPLK